MPDTDKSDYTIFDHPDILSVLFHPRKDVARAGQASTKTRVLIPVEENVSIGGAFHAAGKRASTILFFHGNGEIVSDYNDIGRIFVRHGINFFPVDYRGYGLSSGSPTVSAMMSDCRVIFDDVKHRLADSGYSGKLFVMGRSLGSACALELADARPDGFSGLIIESGFAYALPLLELMGVDIVGLGLTEDSGFRNIDKVARCPLPLRVIHAEYDHIIPFSDGRALFDASPAADKEFITIYGADHNTIFYHGLDAYIAGISAFVGRQDD